MASNIGIVIWNRISNNIFPPFCQIGGWTLSIWSRYQREHHANRSRPYVASRYGLAKIANEALNKIIAVLTASKRF